MKNLFGWGLIVAIAFFSACAGGGSNKVSSIAGEWKLTGLEKEGEGAIELKDCDQQTPWIFKKDMAEPLGDGTEVMQVIATAPEGCKFFGFDSKWNVIEGKLFISKTTVGGMGGVNNAGMFDIVELTPDKMVLKIIKHTYTFSK